MASTSPLPPQPPSSRGRLFRDGHPWVWLTRCTTALLLLLVAGVLGIVVWNGLGTFWPARLVRYEMADGTVVVGKEMKREVRRVGNDSTPEEQIQVRVGNRDEFGVGADFRWIRTEDVRRTSEPEDLVELERVEYGPAFGRVREVREDGKAVASGPAALDALRARMKQADERRGRLLALKKGPIAATNHRLEDVRLAKRRAAMSLDPDGADYRARVAALDAEGAAAQADYERVAAEAKTIQVEDARHEALLEHGSGEAFRRAKPVSAILRVDEVNRLGFFGRFGLAVSRFVRFVLDDPREANTDGGIWPSLYGTMLMTLLMALLVVPFGVLAALYLREYAKQGPVVAAVRVAVNNLAGVPSVVFGVFGLGFFCYVVGGWIDQRFYAERLPSPTFGGGGILWASLTLALLTVPVVIVATEEALAAVPKALREASIACGASKWQTIRRVVLPHASPGILTGMILAMARGAGEVAPLMLTGVVKNADELPLDATAPFFHPERRFMHLGFHIYDTGFQSPNVDASTPLVYSTTLVLLALVLALNLGATILRNRLRRKFRTGVFG